MLHSISIPKRFPLALLLVVSTGLASRNHSTAEELHLSSPNQQLSVTHYTALPFTRMTVGHSDFLPTYVRHQYLKNTTATFQMATAIVATSPFLCWPDHPDDYLAGPFADLIKELPVVWDETRVLPGSVIGNFVVFAWRSTATCYRDSNPATPGPKV